MSTGSHDIPWFESWSNNQFVGVTTPEPPAEPSLDDAYVQEQFDRIQHQVPELQQVINAKRADVFRGKLVRVRMAVVETMDPEYYPGAIQHGTGQWKCAKYGNDRNVLLQGNPKNVAYWERIPVCVQSVPGEAEWCHDKGSMDNVCSKLKNQSICDTSFPDPYAPDGNSCIVLLYDSAVAAVHIHDVIDVTGVLDNEHHIEGSDEDDFLADDFDVMMESENVGCNENEGAVLPQQNVRQPTLTCHILWANGLVAVLGTN